MKPKNQKSTGTPRRKSKTLTLTREVSWLMEQLIERNAAETLAFYPEGEQQERARARFDAEDRTHAYGHFGNRLLELALEATLSRESVLTASAWWKLEPSEMSGEEMAARSAISLSFISPRDAQEIDDAREAAGIALIKAGKEAASWNGV